MRQRCKISFFKDILLRARAMSDLFDLRRVVVTFRFSVAACRLSTMYTGKSLRRAGWHDRKSQPGTVFRGTIGERSRTCKLQRALYRVLSVELFCLWCAGCVSSTEGIVEIHLLGPHFQQRIHGSDKRNFLTGLSGDSLLRNGRCWLKTRAFSF